MYTSQLLLSLGLLARLAFSQIPPSQDPWYSAPSGYESAAPGTILRSRPAPGNLTSLYGNTSAAYNILYRTTDSNYKPSWAVTTLLAPSTKTNASEDGIISYQIPYNSLDIDDGPSYGVYSYTSQASGFLYASDISYILGAGYYALVPDFEGPQAAFLALVGSGHNILDSIRAARSLGNSTCAPSKNARATVWGYSGGSLSSEFAVELAVQYTPELHLAGAALGGLPTNLTDVFVKASGSPFAALVPLGLVGLSRQHPALQKTLSDGLKQNGTYNSSTFLSVNNLTNPEAITLFNNMDISQYFTKGFDFFNEPGYLKWANRDMQVGYHGYPQGFPLFVYKAIHDETCAVEATDALVPRWCGIGATVLYQKNTVGGHIDEETNGNAAARAFLTSVLAKTFTQTGCISQTVTVNISDTGL